MKQQSADGHQTALLWPGRMGIFSREAFVKSRGFAKIEGASSKIQSYELCSPLPVSYDEGIVKFQAFTKDAGTESYERLLKEFCPDVIHIHTLIGLHKSFLETAKSRNIPCVFTAHDYFPICPAVTLFYQGQVCTGAKTCSQCPDCNTGALPLWKIKILQSPLYRTLKDTPVVRRLRKHHRDRHLSGKRTGKNRQIPAAPEDYRRLREHYGAMLKYMDCIHYNSTATKAIYEQYFRFTDSVVINISHGDIQDNRKKKEFPANRLRLLYLGPEGEAKGFSLLQKALDKLWETNQQFYLNIYFQPSKPSSYMRTHRRFDYSDLEAVFDHTDLLIMPSIWQETFGYGVLEALSFGVPVLISGNVGAKEILAEGAGIIIEDISEGGLYDALRKIDSSQLSRMNEVILKKQEIPRMCCVAEMIEKRCYGWDG